MDELLLFSSAPNTSLKQAFQSLDELKLTTLFPVSILGRGFTYYYEGWIENLLIKQEHIQATVSGNAVYSIQIQQKGGNLYGNCNCPFEGKCKHMAAVMISAMHQIQAKP